MVASRSSLPKRLLWISSAGRIRTQRDTGRSLSRFPPFYAFHPPLQGATGPSAPGLRGSDPRAALGRWSAHLPGVSVGQSELASLLQFAHRGQLIRELASGFSRGVKGRCVMHQSHRNLASDSLRSPSITKALATIQKPELGGEYRDDPGRRSANARSAGFLPAFRDTETGSVYPSRYADGRPAPCHVLDGLPEDLVVARDATGLVIATKPCVVAGFLRCGCFYTREEAARAVRGH
jgi:hypothetical protein